MSSTPVQDAGRAAQEWFQLLEPLGFKEGGLPLTFTGCGEESVPSRRGLWLSQPPLESARSKGLALEEPPNLGLVEGECPVCKVWLWGGQDIFRPYCEHLLCFDCARMINTMGDQPRRNKCFTCQCWWWGYWTAPNLPTETCKPRPRDQKRDPDRDDDDHSGRGGHNQATAC